MGNGPPAAREGLIQRCADTTLKASLKGKRKSAAWDNAFMATLIKG